jgi:hypothetical protein
MGRNNWYDASRRWFLEWGFDMEKIEVLLYGLTKGCGLIIPFPSGIVYWNQVAGMTCGQRALEGIYVPVDWDDVAGAMEDTFIGGALDTEDADRMDAKLIKYGAKVDRSKLGESCESWVWLSLEKGVRFIREFASAEAVLTWPNSD